MSRATTFSFRLYVAGGAPNSLQAVANLTALCRRHLPERHAIEIVDIFIEPKRALRDGVFLTPTLMKLSPSPSRRIVGTLNQPDVVLQVLDLGRPVSWP